MEPPVKIRLVYDNRLDAPGFEKGWGFSCLVEDGGKKILFDTGDDGGKLMSNLAMIGVSPDEIGAVILSHDHWDHTGGLRAFLKARGKTDIFAASSFGAGFEKDISGTGLNLSPHVQRVSDSVAVTDRVRTTDELPGVTGPNEIGCVILADKGPVLICGCSHPGVVAMIQNASMIAGAPLYAVFGGAHFYKSGPDEIKKAMADMRKEGVKKCGLCHCTGDAAIDMFRKEWGADFIDFASVREVEL